MKILFWLTSMLLSLNLIASDLTIGSTITSPVSGCTLSSAEIVKITIINADNSPYSGTFDISFISGATTVTETITIPVLPTSATYIYEFTGTLNLSACGVHNITFAVSDINDTNSANDTIIVAVTSDCNPIAGVFSGPSAVCESGNSGQIMLSGNTGIISDWAYSEDGGTTLTNLANTTNMQSYTDIAIDRLYRVYYDSQYGYCPSDSTDFLVTVDTPSNGGVLTSDSSHCDTILPTTLYLNGYIGNIINYQLSLNGGTSYTTYVNPYDTLQYTELSSSFQYFAITQNGSCPSDSSNIVSINLLNLPDAGTITGDDSLCFGPNSTDLEVINYDGNILDWEYSTNGGVNWLATGLTSNNITLNNLTLNTQIRVIVEKQPCGIDTSYYNITVLPASDAGVLAGSTEYCSSINSGFVYTTLIAGNILGWVLQEEGNTNMIDINTTNDTLFYNNLTVSSSYAVIVQNGNCPPDTSNFVTITINPSSEAGNVLVADTICSSPLGVDFTLTNYSGTIIGWEYSITDGLTWNSSGTLDSIFTLTNAYGSINVRAIVQNGTCEADTSINSVFIYDPISTFALEDTIEVGDSITLNFNQGISFEWTPNIYIDNNLIANPKVSPPINTVYELTVIDSNGCASTSTHSIIVTENTKKIVINNLITPNGDGYNDTWLIKNIELFPNNSVYVFDSYGQLIYEASPYQNNWEVSSFNLPDGTYFYAVKTAPSEATTKGTITVINSK